MDHADPLIIESGAPGQVDPFVAERGEIDGEYAVDADIIKEGGKLDGDDLPTEQSIKGGYDEGKGAGCEEQDELGADKGGYADRERHHPIEIAAMPGKKELAIVHDKNPGNKHGS